MDRAGRLGDVVVPVCVDRHSCSTPSALSAGGRVARGEPDSSRRRHSSFTPLRPPRPALRCRSTRVGERHPRVTAVARAGRATAIRARAVQSRNGPDHRRPARHCLWRDSRHSRGAVFEGRWRPSVARCVSAIVEGTVSDHHADLRRLMAERFARSEERFARHFAERGYLVVAIDYRHAPEWKWPEQIVDVRTALYWISQEAGRFGGDASRIVVVGWSAGAQLAMRLAYQEGPSSIRGVVNYYGPVDLANGWRQPPRPDPADVRGILEMFIGGTPDQKPEHYRHASPISWVSKASAPTLSIYGSRDHIVEARFGRMLDAAMRAPGPRRCCSSFRGRSTRSTPFPTEWAAGLRCAIRSGSWRGLCGSRLSSRARHRESRRGSPVKPATLRHRSLPAASPAEAIDQTLRTPPASNDTSWERATTISVGDSGVTSTAIVAGFAAIDDASFFRPLASHPATAARTTLTAPILSPDESKARGFVSSQPLVQPLLRLLLAAACRLQLLYGRRQLVGKHRQQPHASADRVLQAAVRSQRAAAADELHAQSALEPLEAGDGDDADRARSGARACRRTQRGRSP